MLHATTRHRGSGGSGGEGGDVWRRCVGRLHQRSALLSCTWHAHTTAMASAHDKCSGCGAGAAACCQTYLCVHTHSPALLQAARHRRHMAAPNAQSSTLPSPVVPPTQLLFNSRRSPVLGLKAAVACSQNAASVVGADVLRAGGNAIDAAVAMAAALAVTEPCSSGLGGDCFLLYYDSALQQVHGLNGSGRCASQLTLERALRDTGVPASGRLPLFHAHAVTVPGAAAAWDDAVSRWGSGALSLAQLLDPAARLAEEGFAVGPITAHMWEAGLNALDSSPNGRELWGRGGDGGRCAPQCGEVFRNPGMAATLTELGQGGKRAFYSGRAGRAIVEVVAQAGGVLSLDDLTSHETAFPEPIHVDYRGARVYEVPPNGQGITALLALNILRHLEAREGDGSDTGGGDSSGDAEATAARLHAQIEALRLAFADTRYYCADPDVVAVPVVELLSDCYARSRAQLFDPAKACEEVKHGGPASSSCTVSFVVVDSSGSAVSMVVSNYEGFGTGLVPKGCGFTLQNRGVNFSLDATHANCLAPGKRPYHTIIPCMVTDAATGGLYCSLTNMGGFMQPQGHVQLLCRLLRERMDPQSAIDAPRFCITDVDDGRTVAMEDGMPEEVVEALRRRGHHMRVVRDHARSLFGRAQIIVRDAASGVLWAGSDGRGDGMAIAF